MMRNSLILSIIAVPSFIILNKSHEVVSPLISGPIAAQQLSDSNVAYIGTQVASSWFNGSGISLWFLIIALALIWIKPILKLFGEKTDA
jgi:hypothetical protein